MKRYMLFSYPCYYPSGGINDLVCRFDKLEEIDFKEIDTDNEKFQILDICTDEIHEFDLEENIIDFEKKNGEIETYDDEDKIKLDIVKKWIDEVLIKG